MPKKKTEPTCGDCKVFEDKTWQCQWPMPADAPDWAAQLLFRGVNPEHIACKSGAFVPREKGGEE